VKSEKSKKTKLSRPIFTLFPVLLLLFFTACSSAPKRPAEIFVIRNLAQSQLNLANQAASRGRYEEALDLLAEARRLAVSVDDPALRAKTSISRGNVLFSLGHHNEAFLALENAAAQAEAEGERVLASLARTNTIRMQLLLLEEAPAIPAAGDSANTATSAALLRAQLESELPLLRPDPLAAAAGYITLAMADKLLGRFSDAENAVRRALDIHSSGLYLEDAAYDWFFIASIRSVAGNYDAALQALRQAIDLDRRAENSYGLASSWQAMGYVYQKAGKVQESRAAWRRAAEIFRSINLVDKALELENRLEI
jgi:tetratricopeptide (TPR) repeat protein